MARSLRLVVIAFSVLLTLDVAGIGVVLDASLRNSVSTGSEHGERPDSSGAQQNPFIPKSTSQTGWRQSGPSYIVHALAVSIAYPRSVYAATVDGFFRSDDAGATWRSHNAGLPAGAHQLWNLICYDHGRRLAAASDDGHIYLSDDQGSYWHVAGSAIGYGGVYAVAADPRQPSTLLAGAAGGIWRSSDGGGHWRHVFSAQDENGGVLTWIGGVQGTVYAGLVPGPRQIVVSHDAGLTWRAASDGLDGAEGIMALVSAGSDGGVLAGTMGHSIWRREARRSFWRFSGGGLPPGSHGASLLVVPGSSATYYVGTMGMGVFRSIDGGHTWVPFGPPLPGAAGIVLAMTVSSNWLLVGTGTGIYRFPLSG